MRRSLWGAIYAGLQNKSSWEFHLKSISKVELNDVAIITWAH